MSPPHGRLKEIYECSGMTHALSPPHGRLKEKQHLKWGDAALSPPHGRLKDGDSLSKLALSHVSAPRAAERPLLASREVTKNVSAPRAAERIRAGAG